MGKHHQGRSSENRVGKAITHPCEEGNAAWSPNQLLPWSQD